MIRLKAVGEILKRRKIPISIGLGVLVVGAVVTVALTSSPPTSSYGPAEAAPPPTSTPAPFETPPPSETVALSTSATESDQFDSWIEKPTSSGVRFLASDEAHDDSYSLAIVSDQSSGPDSVPQLEQSVVVTGGMTYRVSYWVKSVGLTPNALRIDLESWGSTTTLAAPEGAYEWTEVGMDYVVPDGESTMDVRLAMSGETSGAWVDNLTVSAADGSGNVLVNAGFESHSADLAVANTTLMLEQGSATVELATRREGDNWAHWAALSQAGALIEEGDVDFTDGKASVDLTGLPQALYSLSVHGTFGAKTVDVSLPFGVLNAMPEVPGSSESAFGAGMHIFTDDQRRLENAIGSMAAIGVEYARVDMPWEPIEPSPGVYAYSPDLESTMGKFASEGIEPLVIPAYRNPAYDGHHTPSSPAGLEAYARFAEELASHWSSMGASVDVYNEFNHTFNDGACGVTPECYMDMLTTTYPTIKSSNPTTVVSAPGLSGMGFHLDWLQKFIDLGGLAYTDVVSAHPYVQPAPPETLVSDMDTLRQMIRHANGGQDKPIWLTEMGWATVPNWVTDQQQAEYLVRTMAISLAHGASRVYWYTAVDGSHREGDIESNFGLFEADESYLPFANAPKLSAMAQGVMSREIAGKTVSSSSEFSQTPYSTSAYSYVFAGTTGETRVMWSTDVARTVSVASIDSVTVTTMMGESSVLEPVNGVVTVELSGAPIYVSGSEISVIIDGE